MVVEVLLGIIVEGGSICGNSTCDIIAQMR